MKAFWRDEMLTSQEATLLDLVLRAQEASAHRDNISTSVLRSTFAGSWSFQQAVAGAVLTFGGMHGPIEQTMDLLVADRPEQAALEMLGKGFKVPGWGSSFENDIWAGVAAYMKGGWPDMGHKIDNVSRVLEGAGKKIEPNPSCWTAGMNLIVGLPRHLALWPVLQGRLPSWAEILL
jgi:hypothetical protein